MEKYEIYALLEGDLVQDIQLILHGEEEARGIANMLYINGGAVKINNTLIKRGDRYKDGYFEREEDGQVKIINIEKNDDSELTSLKNTLDFQTKKIKYLEDILKQNNIKF